MDKQIKSKKRVSDFGEVYTNEREVNAMLDLVKSETERIESRFLEPACGDGNFLVEILRRKLEASKKQSKFKGKIFPNDYQKKSILSLCSIYGVDLLQDNVETCIERLYKIWNKEYTKIMKTETNDKVRKIALYILKHNILCGDTLTMLKNDGTPIIFAQWDFVTGDNIKRRDYRLDGLMRADAKNKKNAQLSLADIDNNIYFDEAEGAWVPRPIKEYPPMNYLEINIDESTEVQDD